MTTKTSADVWCLVFGFELPANPMKGPICINGTLVCIFFRKNETGELDCNQNSNEHIFNQDFLANNY